MALCHVVVTRRSRSHHRRHVVVVVIFVGSSRCRHHRYIVSRSVASCHCASLSLSSLLSSRHQVITAHRCRSHHRRCRIVALSLLTSHRVASRFLLRRFPSCCVVVVHCCVASRRVIIVVKSSGHHRRHLRRRIMHRCTSSSLRRHCHVVALSLS